MKIICTIVGGIALAIAINVAMGVLGLLGPNWFN